MARFTRDGRLSRCCGKRMPSKNCSITSRHARPVVTAVTPALSDLVSARATPLRSPSSNGLMPRQWKRKSQKNKKKNLRRQKKKPFRQRRNLRPLKKRCRRRQKSRNLKNENGSAENRTRRNNFVCGYVN